MTASLPSGTRKDCAYAVCKERKEQRCGGGNMFLPLPLLGHGWGRREGYGTERRM